MKTLDVKRPVSFLLEFVREKFFRPGPERQKVVATKSTRMRKMVKIKRFRSVTFYVRKTHVDLFVLHMLHFIYKIEFTNNFGT